ncbi:30S ribosomal protein S9 [Meiothermus sp. QL-1]|uniref:30S ribosomal protein S9 n=1 Tax=Meiothermus sp. QL-1 TaxID=2058095 RepID=UPI000E0AD20B|nr:30S ribosomal protein S9 [Meiothermus sp. QL-1]RDI96510.1 30S ribosomal protein S9 [Meiothermus sp. QL-1]
MEQYYGTGRRKTSVARVFLRPGSGKIEVNRMPFSDYFGGLVKAVSALEPLRRVDVAHRFDAYITVRGGGKSGQIDAIKLGLARALVNYDSDLRAKLKPAGLLSRDPREVERKKYGKHKARRSPQYSKR